MSENLSEQQPEPPLGGNQRESQPPRREIEMRQSETFVSLYANNVSLRTTAWDIQLTFGEIQSVDERTLVIENQLAVNLSPQQAKALANALSGQVQAYERQFGEIRYTPIQPQTEESSA
jgi:hypothetical protein